MRRRNSREAAQQPAAERTRRGLLAGAAGALGLLAGETILSAAPAQAADGDPLTLGRHNTASNTTFLDCGGSGTGLSVLAAGPAIDAGAIGGPGMRVTTNTWGSVYAKEAVYAQSGFYAGTTPGQTHCGVHGVSNSPSDSGVWGEAIGGGNGVSGSTSSAGITGPAGVSGLNSGSGPAVKGESHGGAAVYGLALANSEGVYGQSGALYGTRPGATRNGVHGVTDSPYDSGVWGEGAGGGFGVSGTTTTKGLANPAGVYGENTGTGPGVTGFAPNGTGLYGLAGLSGVAVQATNSGGGTALAVSGRAVFNRSGVVPITAPATIAAVTVPGGLTAAALVLALLQTSAPGVWVTAAVPDTVTGQIKIELNAAPSNPATVQIAWFVIN